MLANSITENIVRIIDKFSEMNERREARRTATGSRLIYLILGILGVVAGLATIASSVGVISGESLAFVYGAIIGALIPFAQYEVAPLLHREPTE